MGDALRAGVRSDAEADVVVVGAGMAGLCASLTALELGARVVTIEKGPRPDGSMLLSGGLVWTFADKRRLREEITDGSRQLQELVVDRFPECLAWLAGQGVRLDEERRFMWYGRGRRAEARQMAAALIERIAARRGEIRLETPMSGFILERGAVRGVAVWAGDLPLTLAQPGERTAAPVPNLYAAGADVGGISCGGYVGGLATALVTARVATASALDALPEATDAPASHGRVGRQQ
jgi:NADPH-dependent 2,4-dienoyl-CoA reductase/sulfur reductase-like enzyme